MTIKSKIPISKPNLTASKPSAILCKQLQLLARVPDQLKVLAGIDKNSILLDYLDFCNAKGIQDQVSTIAKGETLLSSYPSPHRLIANCKMKQSKSFYYQAKELHFDNMVIFAIRGPGELYMTANNLESLKSVNKTYREMINDVQRLRFVDFTSPKLPRLDYAEQTGISSERVDQATACAIHYGLNPGMVIRVLMGEYVGETRDSAAILAKVSPYINKEDRKHIKRIINQGCPSHLHFEEEYENKHLALWKGNQHTFLLHPEVTTKAMNKKEKISHVLPFKRWLVYFSPWCCVTPQGIREKYNKFRVIFDSFTQTSPDEIVLNHETSTDGKAVINFSQAKTRLLINIYNWRMSYPDEIIYLALADIPACF